MAPPPSVGFGTDTFLVSPYAHNPFSLAFFFDVGGCNVCIDASSRFFSIFSPRKANVASLAIAFQVLCSFFFLTHFGPSCSVVFRTIPREVPFE